MDHPDRKEFAQRLLSLLKKILRYKNVDDTQIDKILSCVDDELRIHDFDMKNICEIKEWLSENIEKWKKTQISLHEAQFICKFIELISKYSEPFYKLQSTDVLNHFIGLLEYDLLKLTTMKITLIKMLCAILDNNSGYAWIKTSQVWKLVVSVYLSSANLYIEREAIKFFKKLFSAAKNEENIIEDVLSHIFLPIKENFTTIVKDKKLHSNILLFLKLLEIILKVNMFSENNNFLSEVEKFCNLETFLKNVVENSEQELTSVALQSQILLSVIKFDDKKKLLSTEDIPTILNLFTILIEQNKFNCIIKLAKYCQIIWNEIRKQMDCGITFGVNFILMQLLPSLTCVNMAVIDKEYDLLMKKLFNQKSPQSQKFFHLLENAVKSSFSSKPSDIDVKGILSVITNLDSYNTEEGILIFQAMLYITKSLISESGYDLETTKKLKKLGSHGIKNRSLLSAILNGVPLLLEKIEINWTDLEALGLFKIVQCLLNMSDLPSLVVSQTLGIVKVAILSCKLPNAAKNSIYSNFESLAPIICKLMTDSSWETRDSSIEVVIAIAELSKSKHTTNFEQMLLEKNFPLLLLDIVENDTESYVRASAIRALTIMTKIETLNPFLNNQDFCLKITKLIETESEGIVRREAALLIKEIYLTLNDQHSDLKNQFYRVMCGAALCDLYWEVKISSLVFWEAVIQRIIADQKIIQEPVSNADCLSKNVIKFSKGDMKLELYKSLKKLSKIGCLYVLLTILKEDCDMIVIKKSAEVLSYLLNILKDLNFIESDNLSSTSVCKKRKNSGLLENENNKIPSMTKDNNAECDLLQESFSMSFARSEKIIEEIVNDTDFNLLKKVPSQNVEINICHKPVFIKEIEPEIFLLQMQRFDKDQFLENKQKSFINVETDMALTMSEIINTEHSANEINVMDCY